MWRFTPGIKNKRLFKFNQGNKLFHFQQNPYLMVEITNLKHRFRPHLTKNSLKFHQKATTRIGWYKPKFPFPDYTKKQHIKNLTTSNDVKKN